eukprot:3941451-Rhodomonas_salina.5
MYGTDLAYRATTRTDLLPTNPISPPSLPLGLHPIALRACYAMPSRVARRGSAEGLAIRTLARAAVSAYARAMRCPVLTYRMLLSAYARAMRCPVSGTDIARTAYARATRCPVLRSRMALPVGSHGTRSTEIAFFSLMMPGTEIPYYLRIHRRCLVLHSLCCATFLRLRYAMSGTDLAYAATRSQGLAGDATVSQVSYAISLLACYAVSGRDLSYAAIGLCGTDRAYGGATSRRLY